MHLKKIIYATMTRLWFLNMTYNSYPIQDEQGTMVAKLLPTEARLRDGRPKFRNAKKVFKATQKKFVTTRKERKGRRVTAVVC